MTDKGEENLTTKIKLSRAITLIKASDFKTAGEILLKIKSMYREAKQYKSATICTVLLGECALYKGDSKGFTK